MATLKPLSPQRLRAEDGTTLVELLVALSLLAVLGVVVVGGVTAFMRGAQGVQSSSHAQAELWQVFTTLDQQVRYADAVNRAGTAHGAVWVEFRSTSPHDPVPRCYQWRYTGATGELDTRSWAVDTLPQAHSWTTVLTTVVDPDAVPFTTVGTTTTTPHVQVRVLLPATAGTGPESSSSLSTTFVARNTSPESLGNLDVDGDGASDHPVCASAGYRS